MNTCYRAGFPGILYSGRGSLKMIDDIMKTGGYNRIVVLADSVLTGLPVFSELVKLLGYRIIAVITDIPAEPPIGSVRKVYARLMEAEADLLLAVGGGSVMDMAKIVAAAATNPDFASPESGTAFTDTDKIIRRGIPTVMVPTTAGTGAEATPNAVFLFPEKELKIGICSDAFVASYVILDPELTASLPPKLTASTGIDALCHAVESYISTMANPVSKTFSLRAAGLICQNIERAYLDGGDMEARENMLLGSFFAGMCLFSSTTVAVHALSYPLGGRYHIPHGIANAILLPHVMEANLSVCEKEYGELAQVMLPDYDSIPGGERGFALVDYFYQLCGRLDIPTTLTQFGIGREDIDTLTDNAFQVKRLLSRNPRELTRNEIREIYEKLL